MTTLSELTTPLTSDAIKTAIYQAMTARGLVTTSWKPGAVVRTIVAAVAIVIAAFSKLVALIASNGFLELAEDAWLEIKAREDYGVEKDAGSFATGYVTLSNAGGGVYSGDPDDLLFTNPTTGKSYRNTAAYSIGALQTGVIVPIRAVELGAASTSAAGTITQMETPLLGVTCTNAAAVVGTDPETDAALRARAREKTGALSPNGPVDAYAYFAKSATRADGSSVGVTRVNAIPDGFGGVAVFVATATGTITGTANDPNTDLGAVSDAIWKNVAPLAVTPAVQAATAKTIAVTYELWVREAASLTAAQIEALVGTAIATHLASVPIGGDVIPSQVGRVYVSAIRTAIGAVLPAGTLIRVDVTLPAADVDCIASDAPIAGTITATAVHLVSGGSV